MSDLQFDSKPSSRVKLIKTNKSIKTKTSQNIYLNTTSQEQRDTWANHNFKKNSGYKPIWSCGGYGGKCGNCKNQCWDQPIRFKKDDIRLTVSSSLKEYHSAQSI